MNVFIYFYDRLPCGLDQVEDCLAETLDNSGEITGSGTGVSGSNIDIEVIDGKLGEVEVLKMVREGLAVLHLPRSTVIKIEGKAYSIRE